MAATVHGIKAGKAFVLIEAVDRTGKVLNGIKNHIGRWGSEISAMGTTIALRAAMAIAPAVFSSKMFADFDDSMKKVEARSKGTAQQMADLRTQAKELGRVTAFTSSQIGELQARLAQFGKTRGDILKMTEPIMNLARAGGEGKDLGLDIVQATDATTQILAAYRLETEDTVRVTDLLAAAVNTSRFTLEELSVALQYAAPAGKRFNVSLEDMLVGLGAIRELGVDASIAGTAFRNMLLYVSQAKERMDFNKELQRLTGNTIKFTDVAGNLKNPIDMLLAIGEATRDLGNVDAADLFTKLFETRATIPAMGVSESIKSIQRMRAELANAAGTAKRTHDIMESGLGGGFRELASAAEAVALSLGEALSNSLLTIIKLTNENLASISRWIDAHKGLVTILTGSIATVGAYGVALIVLGQTMRMLTSLFVLVIVPLKLFSHLVNLTTGLIAMLSRGIMTFISVAVVPLLSYLIRMAVVLATRLIVGFVQLSIVIAQSVVSAFSQLANIGLLWFHIQAKLVYLGLELLTMFAAVAVHVMQLVALFGSFGTGLLIGAMVVFVLAAALIIVTEAWEYLTTAVSEAKESFELILGMLQAVGDGLSYIGSLLATELGKAIQDVIGRLGKLREFWLEAWEDIQEAVEAGDLKTAWAIAFSLLKVTALNAFNVVMNAWDSMIEQFLNGLMRFQNVMTLIFTILKKEFQALIFTISGPAIGRAMFASVDGILASLGLDEANIAKSRKLLNDLFNMDPDAFGEGPIRAKRKKHFEELKRIRDEMLKNAEKELALNMAEEAAATVDEFRELEALGLEKNIIPGVDNEDLKNRINGFMGAGDVAPGMSPTSNVGVRAESIEAAKAFAENKFNLWQSSLDTLIGEAEEQNEHLASINKKLSDTVSV